MISCSETDGFDSASSSHKQQIEEQTISETAIGQDEEGILDWTAVTEDDAPLPPAPEELIERNVRLFDEYVERGESNGAIQCAVENVILNRIIHGDTHLSVLIAHLDLAKAYYELKNYSEQAQQHCKIALDYSNSIEDTKHLQMALIDLYCINARALGSQKKFSEAEKSLNKAALLLKDLSGDPGVDLDALDLKEIELSKIEAKVLERLKKNVAAMAYMERAIELARRHFGGDSIELIPMLQFMCKAKRDVDYAQRALNIATKNNKQGGEDVAESTLFFAKAIIQFEDDSCHGKAEKYLNDAIASFLHAGSMKKALDAEDQLTKLQVKQERTSEAISMLRKSLPLRAETYSEYSDEFQEDLNLLANLFVVNEEGHKAVEYLKQLEALQTLVYSSQHKKVQATQKQIALLMSNPNVATKVPKSKGVDLKSRPKFSETVKIKH